MFPWYKLKSLFGGRLKLVILKNLVKLHMFPNSLTFLHYDLCSAFVICHCGTFGCAKTTDHTLLPETKIP